MDWAAAEWKMGLPPNALQRVNALEQQLEHMQKERQQKHLKIENLEQIISNQKRKEEEQRSENCSLQRELQKLSDQCKDFEMKHQKLQSDLQSREAKANLLEGQLLQMKKQSNMAMIDLQKTCTELEVSLKSNKEQMESLKTEVDRLRTELHVKDDVIAGQNAEISKLTESLQEKTVEKKEVEFLLSSAENLRMEKQQLEDELIQRNSALSESEKKILEHENTIKQQAELNAQLQVMCSDMEAQRQELENVRRKLEEKSLLQSQSESRISELEKALQMKTELNEQLEASYAELELRSKERNELLQAELEEAKKELDARTRTLSQTEHEISELKNSLQKKAEANEQLLAELKNSAENALKEAAESKDELSEMKRQLDQNMCALSDKETRVSELEECIQSQLKDIGALQARCSELETASQTSSEQAEQLGSELQELRHEIELKTSENAELSKALEGERRVGEQMQEKYFKLEVENNAHQEVINNMKSDLGQMKDEMEKKNTNLLEAETKVSELQELLEKQRNENEGLQVSYSEAQRNLEEFQLTRVKLEQLTVDLDARNLTLTETEKQLLGLQEAFKKQSEAYEVLQESYSEMQRNCAYSQEQVEATKAQMEQLINELDSKTAALSKSERLLQEMEEALKNQSKVNAELEESHAKAEDFKMELDQVKSELDSRNTAFAEREAQVADLKESLKKQTEAYEVLQESYSEMQHNCAHSQEQVEATKAQMEQLINELDSKTAALSKSERLLQEMEEALKNQSEANEQLLVSCAEMEDLKAELSQVRSELDGKNCTLSETEAEMNDLRESLEKQIELSKLLETSYAELELRSKEKNELLDVELEETKKELDARTTTLSETEHERLELKNSLHKEIEVRKQIEAEYSKLEEENRDHQEAVNNLKSDLEQMKVEVEKKIVNLVEAETRVLELGELLDKQREANKHLEDLYSELQRGQTSSKEETEALKAELVQTKEAADEKEALLLEKEAKITELEQSLQRDAEAAEKLQKAYSDLENANQTMCQELGTLEAELKQLNCAVNANVAAISEKESRISELEQALQMHIKENEELKDKCSRLGADSSSTCEQVKLLEQALQQVKQEVENKNSMLSENSVLISSLEENLQRNQQANEQLEERCCRSENNLKVSLEQTQKLETELTEVKNDSENKIRERAVLISELQADLKQQTQENEEQRIKFCELQDNCRSYELHIESLKAECDKLKAELETQAGARSENELQVQELKEALQQQNEVHVQLKAMYTELESTTLRCQKEVDTLQIQLDKAKNDLDLKDAVLSEYSSKIEELERTLHKQTEVNEQLQLSFSEMQHWQAQFENLKSELDSKNVALTEAESQILELRETLQKEAELSKQLQMTCAENKNLKEEVAQLQTELGSKNLTVLDSENQISQLEDALQRQTELFHQASDQMESMKAEIKKLKNEQKLESSISAESRESEPKEASQNTSGERELQTSCPEDNSSSEGQLEIAGSVPNRNDIPVSGSPCYHKRRLEKDTESGSPASMKLVKKIKLDSTAESRFNETNNSVTDDMLTSGIQFMPLDDVTSTSGDFIPSVSDQHAVCKGQEDLASEIQEAEKPELCDTCSPQNLPSYGCMVTKTVLQEGQGEKIVFETGDDIQYWKDRCQETLSLLRSKESDAKSLKAANIELCKSIEKLKEEVEVKVREVQILTECSEESDRLLEELGKENQDLEMSIQEWKSKHRLLEERCLAASQACTDLQNANRAIEKKLENCTEKEEIHKEVRAIHSLLVELKTLIMTCNSDPANIVSHTTNSYVGVGSTTAAGNKTLVDKPKDLGVKSSEEMSENTAAIVCAQTSTLNSCTEFVCTYVQTDCLSDADSTNWQEKYEECEKALEAARSKCSSLAKSNALLNQTIDEVEENLQEVFREKQQLQSQLEELQRKNEKSTSKGSFMQAQLVKKQRSANQKMRKLLRVVDGVTNVQLSKDLLLSTKMLAEKLQALNDEKKNLLVKQKHVIDDNRSLIEIQKQTINSLQTKERDYVNKLKASVKRISDIEFTSSYCRRQQEWEQEINKLTSAVAKVSGIARNFQLNSSYSENRNAELAELENSIHRLKEEKDSLLKDIGCLKASKQIQSNSSCSSAREQSVCSSCEEKESTIEKLNKIVTDLHRDVCALESLKEMNRKLKSHNDALEQQLQKQHSETASFSPQQNGLREDAEVAEKLLASYNAHLEKRLELQRRLAEVCLRKELAAEIGQNDATKSENVCLEEEASDVITWQPTASQEGDSQHISGIAPVTCDKCTQLLNENKILRAKEVSVARFIKGSSEIMTSLFNLWMDMQQRDSGDQLQAPEHSDARTNCKKHGLLLSKIKEEISKLTGFVSKFSAIIDTAADVEKEQNILGEALLLRETMASESSDIWNSLYTFIADLRNCVSYLSENFSNLIASTEMSFRNLEEVLKSLTAEVEEMKLENKQVEDFKSKAEAAESQRKEMQGKLHLVTFNSRRIEKCYSTLQKEHEQILEEVTQLRKMASQPAQDPVTLDQLQEMKEKLQEAQEKLEASENEVYSLYAKLEEMQKKLNKSKEDCQFLKVKYLHLKKKTEESEKSESHHQ